MAKNMTYSDIVKNIGLLGVGVYAITKDKAEKFSKELQKSGALDEKAGKKLVNKLLKDSKTQTVKLEKEINVSIKKSMKSMALAQKKDVDKLEKRIAKLEKKLATKKKKAKKK